MSALWNRWVAFVGRPVDSRPFRITKQLIALVLIVDLLAIFVFRADSAALYLAADGGIVGRAQEMSIQLGSWTGPLWWLASLVTLGLVASGRGGRVVLVLAVFAYAQLGHFDWPGDRAIDRICRTTLLIFAFSDVGKARVPERIAAWPGDLIRVLLVVIYLQSGIVKLTSSWSWLSTDLNPLYTIMASPQVGRLDPEFFFGMQPAFAVFGAATLVLEMTAPLLLVRQTAPWWGIFGILLHVGLALTMNLGIFPYAMLCFYVIIMAPWLFPSRSAGGS